MKTLALRSNAHIDFRTGSSGSSKFFKPAFVDLSTVLDDIVTSFSGSLGEMD